MDVLSFYDMQSIVECVNLFTPHENHMRHYYFYLHFTFEETEIYTVEQLIQHHSANEGQRQDSNAGSLILETKPLTITLCGFSNV